MKIPECVKCGRPAGFPYLVSVPYTCLSCQHPEQPEAPSNSEAKGGSLQQLGSETVLDEYVRLDKTIRDCEHALLIAERLKVQGRPLAESETEPVRIKLQETLIERDFLDEWISRRGKSPNAGDEQRPIKKGVSQ